GQDRASDQREEGAVPGAVGHGQRGGQDHRRWKSECAGHRARRVVRLQHARVRHARVADPGPHHWCAGNLRRDPFGTAARRAGHVVGRRARVCARAGARGDRSRRRRRVHRDPPGPRQGAVRRTQHGAAQGDGAAAGAPHRIRQARQGMTSDPSVSRVLGTTWLIIFVTSLCFRAVDPAIPQIAQGFTMDATTVALLSTAFALPYAIMQPLLGAFADAFGKTRTMTVCILLVMVWSFAGAIAATFSLLAASRALTGIVTGGIFPIALAIAGDLVPIAQRQVAIGRLLAGAMLGILLGSPAAGLIGDLVCLP